MFWALMSLGLIASAFAILRATSFGVETDDLTWDYTVAAIWTNLELYLGIIAANVAVSHQIFRYFFPHPTPKPSESQSTSHASTAASRRAIYNSIFDGDGDGDGLGNNVHIESQRDLGSLDTAPQAPGTIRQETEVWLHREAYPEPDRGKAGVTSTWPGAG
jgi:hypothetical protein